MRISVFFLVLGLVHTYASSSYGQSSVKLNLKIEGSTIEAILAKIESETEFHFFYQSEDLKKGETFDIDVKNGTVFEILDLILPKANLSYQVFDKYIAISSSENKVFVQNNAAKQQVIKGKVTDSSGQPLPGVTVVVKGTTNGIITDVDGHYSLPNVSSDAILMFSFVGMKTQEISVDRRATVNVIMEEETVGIEEVVAIGYGTARRKDLTGSVSSVGGATLKDVPVTSAAQAIAGRMAGVQVTKTEGSPDAEIKIRVRGGGSITQDNSPLYIVDGFPVDNISDVAPTDIASIDILKDASSTAIYGARGANGVILITTKGGNEGKAKVSYNMYYGIKEVTKSLDVMSPYEYVLYQYERRSVEQMKPTTELERYYGDFLDFDLYKQMKGINWQDEMFGRTGTSMYHNFAFSGGSKSFKYNVSLTRNDEKEIMLGSGYSRTNLTVKTFHKINDWLTFDLNTRLSDTYMKGAGTSSNSRLYHAIQFRPVDGLMDFVDSNVTDEDFEATNSSIVNPVDQTNDDYRREKDLAFYFNGVATIRFSKSLNYRFEYGTQYGDETDNRFYGINTTNVNLYGYQPIVSITKNDIKGYRLANILTYTKCDFLPGNNITVMVGEELNYYKRERLITSAKYFPMYVDAETALTNMSLGTADPISTTDYPANKISSFFGRLNYDYKGKYLVSATFRADGSSKFAPGNQWGFFPSAALAWRLSDEKFMNETKKWLSDLKLRASYGESGNNRITDDAWKKTFSITSGGLNVSGDGDGAIPTPIILPGSILSNPKLKWETTITRNIGLDFSLFKQHLSGSVEVYKNTTEDLLIKATIPSSSGYSTQWQNIGQTSNRGIEITLNTIFVETKDFLLSASFNIGFNRNRIDNLGEVESWEQTARWISTGGPSGDYLVKEGGQVGQMYGHVTEGMYSFDDFNYANGLYTLKEGVPNNGMLGGSYKLMPGALKLKDQNGDFIIDGKDKVIIGNANPKHSGGATLTAQYKGFDFSAFFNWVYGNNIYNANKLFCTSTYANYPYKNLLNSMNSENRFTYIDKATGDMITEPGQLAEMNKNVTVWTPLMNNIPLHSWGVEDGSFLRLNTLTIGYSLPKNILIKMRINQLRIYASAYNLWTWTNYTGYDPEVDALRYTPLTPGIDWCAYPRSRSFNVGLNVEF
ncbi:MAG TPA: TonB-dependent receptor [Prolixibacteraceae bacterium]|nr:TonB-dependent receptor [Marinilabiliales bacterium]HBL76811.1 TonB-dependent receptor [Prolixibacteraceae bacterium]HCU62808.1 TonB-dependent receptor [Prolixibacteraceae bacterium]